MAHLKIISNPYKKNVQYQQWDENDNTWIDINPTVHKASNLLKKEFTEGFFPFKVKEIVTQMVKDYQIDGEQIDIDFEGSEDEFTELEAVCSAGGFEVPVSANHSNRYLENARDILPEVKKLFQEMNPLIISSVDSKLIERELDRFTDASSDVVPVCVMGNYSSGKSTFINALIGSEILPNGSNPVTTKVYKITKSKYADRASVKFNFEEQPVSLAMREKETKFEILQESNDLTDMLTEQVISPNDEDIVSRMNKAISIINDYEKDEKVSDLIEVEIPFAKGVLAASSHPFVIFDTPGSNSASNAKHLKVLKEAMADMTNGLPIFLATPETLDSTDNENLSKIISELDELDSRFTMIVVNKADKNDLNRKGSTDKEEKLVLSQSIPRNLYSGGIFYVSSIIGLGSKNNGDFKDDFYAETYSDQEHKYNTPGDRWYKQLYTFDIMPSQIKQRVNAAANAEKDLTYVNSGLYSIETEIETFAGKYSAYNKCFQSQLFLNQIIDLTQKSIEDNKKETAETREIIKDKLEEDKQHLLEQMESKSEEKKNEYQDEYSSYMSQFISDVDETFTVENLEEREDWINAKIETEMGLESHIEKVNEGWKAIGQNLKQNVSKAAKEKNKESASNIFTGFISDVNDAVQRENEKKDTRTEIDKKVADELTNYVREKYETRLHDLFESMDQASQDYWTRNTEELRNILVQIVTGSDALTTEFRDELKNIIIKYQQLTFDEERAKSIFRKEIFEKRITLGDYVLWKSNHLNLEKLAKTYNEHMSEDVQERYNVLEVSHRDSAYLWIESLLDEIRANIVKYSPELSKQAKTIQKLTKEIENLVEKKEKLKNYTVQLEEMMDWKPHK